MQQVQRVKGKRCRRELSPGKWSTFCRKFCIISRACVGLLALGADVTLALDFFPATSIELSGSSPAVILTKDINSDNHADLVVTMSGVAGGDGNISVLLGDGTGSFFDEPFTTLFRPMGIAIADLAASEAGIDSSSLPIFIGDGTGTFSPHVTATSGGKSPTAVVAADFNQDAVVDLAVANAAGPGVSILVGNGDGSFAPGVNVPNTDLLEATDLAMGDLNNDGMVDLVVPQAAFLGAGDSSFSRVLSGGSFGGDIAVATGDLSGDSVIDVVSITATQIQVWLGQGDGTFLFGSLTNFGTTLKDVIVVDLDGDTAMDVIVVDASSNSTAVLLGNGDGTLAAPLTFPAGVEPQALVSGDWNEDGLIDIAAPYRNLGDTPFQAVLIQRPPDPVPGSLQFDAAAYQVMENEVTATITVTRSGGSVGTVSVDYTTLDGSANAGLDYTTSSGTLIFADSEISKNFSIPILDDLLFEGNETVNLELSNVAGGANLGIPNIAVLTLIDDDLPSGLQLNITGTCPGTITVTTAVGTPSGNTAFVTGSATGSFTVPIDPCIGLVLGLRNPSVAATVRTDTNGDVSLTPNVGLSACGLFVQAVDVATCTASNVVQISP